MNRLDWSTLSQAARDEALSRPARRRDAAVMDVVRRIFDDVERDGAAGVAAWAVKLDKRAPRELRLSRDIVDGARAKLERDDLEALDLAVANVRSFHEATKPQAQDVQIAAGVRCRREWRPIRTCGLYAPGGSAPLFRR